MDYWACLWVIIDFVFEQQQPELGSASFCTDAIYVAKQSVLGRTLPVKRSKVFSGYVTAFAIFPTSFSNSNSFSQAASCPGEKPYNTTHFRFVSWHTQVYFYQVKCIKAWYCPESVFCEQRIVSRCAFLTMVRIHGQVRYRPRSTANFSKLRWDILRFKVFVGYWDWCNSSLVLLQLLTCHAQLVIDFFYLMECCGCKLIVLCL